MFWVVHSRNESWGLCGAMLDKIVLQGIVGFWFCGWHVNLNWVQK